MTKILPGPGTSAWEPNGDPMRPRNWWRVGSPVHRFLVARGIDYVCPEDPFLWSTELDGIRGANRTWAAGGKALRWHKTAKGIGPQVPIWAHSHFLQLVIHAAAEWHEPIFVDTLVSFGSPLRDDVPWRQALPRIGRWLIVTDEFDLTQMLGRFGDGSLGNPEDLLQRVQVKTIPGSDHSRVLQDRACFELLETEGILAFTRQEEAASV